MSRLHSGHKGKSGSKKPLLAKAPGWLQHTPEEVKALVVKLAKQDFSAANIGNILRDSYGIPDVQKITGQKISKIVAENKLAPDLPEDLQMLLKRAIRAKKHIDSNRKDEDSRRGLRLIESKLRRIIKYYKAQGILPAKWKYDLKG